MPHSHKNNSGQITERLWFHPLVHRTGTYGEAKEILVVHEGDHEKPVDVSFEGKEPDVKQMSWTVFQSTYVDKNQGCTIHGQSGRVTSTQTLGGGRRSRRTRRKLRRSRRRSRA